MFRTSRIAILGAALLTSACSSTQTGSSPGASVTPTPSASTPEASRSAPAGSTTPLASASSVAPKPVSTEWSPPAMPSVGPPTDDLPVPETAWLPALSKDGKTVAAFASVGRMCPVSMVVLVDVKTDKSTTYPFWNTECGKPVPKLVAAARAVLTDREWVRFSELDMEDDPTAPAPPISAMPAPRRAVGARTSVRFIEPELEIALDGNVTVKKPFASWSDPGTTKSCAGCPPCKTYPIIDRAWANPTARIALVGLQYLGGNDICGSPDPAHHVVAY